MRLLNFLLISEICKTQHDNIAKLLSESMPPKALDKFMPLEIAISKLPGIIEAHGAAYPEGNIFTDKPVYCIFIAQEGSTRGLGFLAKLMSRRYYGFHNKGWDLSIDEVTDTTGLAQILLTIPLDADPNEMADIIKRAILDQEWPLTTE